jgi:acylphosphatase
MNELSSDSKLVRRRAIFHGRVQGVGFRYSVASIAKRFPVTGYVKNLPNRTVELVVDGSPETLGAFVAEVSARFDRNIVRVDCEEHASDGSFVDFGIQY